jgi:phosphatidylserine/phosphatidylglycerophosphate/cardiolipin synthase-like enzyme
VDCSVAVVTSANFTEAAHHRNIEVGVLTRYPPFVQRLSDYFEALRQKGQLLKCSLE